MTHSPLSLRPAKPVQSVGTCQCGDIGGWVSRLGRYVCWECVAEIITGVIPVGHLDPRKSYLTLDDLWPLARVTPKGKVSFPGFCRQPDEYFFAMDGK